jgi:hypothetical protein
VCAFSRSLVWVPESELHSSGMIINSFQPSPIFNSPRDEQKERENRRKRAASH